MLAVGYHRRVKWEMQEKEEEVTERTEYEAHWMVPTAAIPPPPPPGAYRTLALGGGKGGVMCAP